MKPTFSQITQSEKDLKILSDFNKNPHGFLLLSGSNGTGKSFAAEAIYNDHTSFSLPYYDHDQAIFITQADLNEEWKNSFENTSQLLIKCKKTKLFVLDDIGTRKPSDAFMDFLYCIADFRWKNRDALGTIITTNLNSAMMRSMFGDAFTSRTASGKILRWDHEDRRFKEF